ncbi:polyphosphate kinase [Chitinophaga silvatica]|uniref:Polyphosphate kinase n=1 Tax=Chitinophaga silvatica TaxID=2282649 RepID=A0A3E1YA24_9BACT|nr:PPK2 family polyphosphate kinase [Chitinophaga silvatica]RFS22522.1 polyphosphate kinase [Chitinophaga silvatica]
MAKIKLSAISTTAPKKLDKDKVRAATRELLLELDELQNLLYAQHKYSVLLVIQGMDASGKDGLIKNVTGTLNPQGVMVSSFKAPTPEEMDHDFLWRIHKHAPAKGMIEVFNRSHYEDILVQRVHKWIDDKTAVKRMKAINAFEKLLAEHNNTQIIKCYLHVSHEAQQQRLVERTEDPRKMWKYNENDLAESKLWPQYMDAYEDAINNCNDIPWLIVPSDQNWYKEYLVALTLRDTLKSLNMKYPRLKK